VVKFTATVSAKLLTVKTDGVVRCSKTSRFSRICAVGRDGALANVRRVAAGGGLIVYNRRSHRLNAMIRLPILSSPGFETGLCLRNARSRL
jgi:hypothetical protein